MPQPTWRETAIASLLLVALVLMAFWKAMTEVYGTSDDFSFFERVLLNGLHCRDLLRGEGRQLLGILYDAVALAVSSFEDTRLFRVVFVVGACASAVVLGRFAIARLGLFPGTAVAGLFVMSPAMLDLASLQPSSASTVGAALVFAGYSAYSAGRRGQLPWSRFWRYAAAALALIASAAIYQTASFVWFVCVGVELLAPAVAGELGVRRRLTGTASATGFFAAVMTLYGAVFLVLIPQVLGTAPASRVELAASASAKAVWFLAQPLRDALIGPYFSALDPQAAMLSALRRGVIPAELYENALHDPAMLGAALVFPLLLWGLWARAGGRPRDRLVVVALGLALLPMSYGVNLLISEMWSSFRTQLALGGVVAVFMVVAVEELVGRVASTAVVRVALCALVLSAFLVIASKERAWTSGPLGCEWQTTRAEVAAAATADAITVVPMRAVDTTAPGLRYDLGWPASAKWWGPIPMIRAARQSLGLPDVPVHVITAEQAAATPPFGTAIVRIGCRP